MKKSLTTHFHVLCLVAACCLLAGCKKDGSSPSSKSSSITTGIWTLQKMQYQQSDGSWAADPDPQDLDHMTLAFHADHTFSETLSGSSVIGHWEATSDFSQITISDGDDINGTYAISTLTSSALNIDNIGLRTRSFFVH